MYAIRASGSAAAAARQIRDIPTRVIPYAASSALTKTAQLAQKAIVAEMPRVFDRPVSYTLNALRIEASTVETLTARVAVKDQAGASGTRPESYLLPEVEGGIRSDKRSERALRYRGVLRPGEQIVPGSAAPLDASGNISGSAMRGILRQLQNTDAKKGRYFVGAVGRKRTRGVWLRTGRSLAPVLLFARPPSYSRRLDFTGIAEKTARSEFPRLFAEAAAAIVARNP